MCQIHDKFTSVWPSLPDAVMFWQELCRMHKQALTDVNITEAWFGTSGYSTGGGKQGLSKHARSKTQTGCTGSQVGSGTEKRFSDIKSLDGPG